MNNLRKAVKITEQVFRMAENIIVPGITEKQIARKLRKCAKCQGADGLAFLPIVSSGYSGRSVHPKPSNRKVGENEFIIIDFGVKCKGVRTDVTRTYCVNPDKKKKKLYELVKKAQRKAEAMIKPGVKCNHVDKAIKKYLKARSTMKFPYYLGHGIGKKTHDKPSFSRKRDDIFNVGDVIAIEPGLHSKKMGLRVEDMYLLTKKGIIKLTKNIPSDL